MIAQLQPTQGKIANLSDQLAAVGIRAQQDKPISGITTQLKLKPKDWGFAAKVAAEHKLRWSAVWGDHRPPKIIIRALLFGVDGHLMLQTEVTEESPELPSQAEFFIAASRPERSLQDMFGVRFQERQDNRRWIRHQAWSETDFPLRQTFPVAGTPVENTVPDNNYPFPAVDGDGVYQIPVGPVHAGIIEPGHFRFQAMGEDILRLEERLGYVHKGIEKIAVGRDLDGLIRLAGRVSGDSTVTHSWAACQAIERALDINLSPRALSLRAILSERERIANHLGDIGAICNDVGFAFAQYQMSRLRELWQRQNQLMFGHRLLMDLLVPGGVSVDLSKDDILSMLQEIEQLRPEIEELLPLLLECPSLQDRLRDYAILTTEDAQRLGAVGYVGRASNLQDDLRRDAPYAPYDQLNVKVPAFSEGDLTKRMRVRGEEILISLDLLSKLLKQLPEGSLNVDYSLPGQEVEGLGLVEGWRGETLAYLRLDEQGKVLRYFPRDPSWLTWQALEMMLDGVIVPDFPVCNKSVNGSYAGHDL
ncbi:MAG: NADH-quinone oxidoreductase subunit C [Desulfuromusa sp.]|nr:NADH-quinone oxidoreductase subunit C [Desulfuromusa sp.]